MGVGGDSPDRIRGAVTSARVREIMGVMTLDRLNPPQLSSFLGPFLGLEQRQSTQVFIFWGLSWYSDGLNLPQLSSFGSLLVIV